MPSDVFTSSNDASISSGFPSAGPGLLSIRSGDSSMPRSASAPTSHGGRRNGGAGAIECNVEHRLGVASVLIGGGLSEMRMSRHFAVTAFPLTRRL